MELGEGPDYSPSEVWHLELQAGPWKQGIAHGPKLEMSTEMSFSNQALAIWSLSFHSWTIRRLQSDCLSVQPASRLTSGCLS